MQTRAQYEYVYRCCQAFLEVSSTHPLIHSSTQPLIHSSTHPLIHSSTNPPIHSSTHPLIHSSINQTSKEQSKPSFLVLENNCFFLHQSYLPPCHPSCTAGEAEEAVTDRRQHGLGSHGIPADLQPRFQDGFLSGRRQRLFETFNLNIAK